MYETEMGMGEQKSIKGMRLVLLTDTGIMKSMWIAGDEDGKFMFESSGENVDYSFLSIIVSKGIFTVRCYKKSFIMTQENTSTLTSFELKNGLILAIKYGQHMYKLYVEAEADASNVFHNYFVPKHAVISVGRATNNDICYNNKMVSSSHAFLKNGENGWIIKDDNSTNGVYVNGRSVSETKLNLGDRIYIMGLQIIVGIDFISINDHNDMLHINPTKLVYVTSPADLIRLGGASPVIEPEEVHMFNRLPRSRQALNADDISVESPPARISDNGMPMMLRMGGQVVSTGSSLGSSIVSGGMQALMTGNVVSMASSLIFPFLTSKYSEKEKKEYEAKRVDLYTKYLEFKRREIEKEKYKEEKILNENYPAVDSMWGFIDTGKRLWERRIRDDDFMSLRVGHGTTPMIAEVKFPQESLDLEEDPLETRMFEMAKEKREINNVPIMIDFTQDIVSGVVGPRQQVLNYIERLIVQMTVLHSSDEVKLVCLLDQEELEALSFIKYLPHVWNDYKDQRYIATSKSEAFKIGEVLRREVEEDLLNPKKLPQILAKRPYYMVLAFDKTLFDSAEVLKDVMSLGTNCGVSIITLFNELPKECTKIVRMSNDGKHVVSNLAMIENPNQEFYLDSMDLQKRLYGMKKLANTVVKTKTASFALPKMVTFLEMFGVGKIEHLNIMNRWKENNPTKSLSTPIGVATDGGLFNLDLHEKRQGPHGLVAGMTGSGKSEVIITYILSMAINYHPDEVAFVLIDYKGGGLAGAFENEKKGIHLPHLVGTITNLDGGAIFRSIASIESELKRRQAIFNQASKDNDEGTMNIYDYQKLYRAGKVKEPVPHLFIISDEFAELKAQQPEFMDQLISTARIGRSLGVHLILATQKPAGVVNDQILSNTKFRICLKVQDKMDSMDMLKRPEAAELKDTGRFYLQVGYNELFALGQSAWCGADYEPQEEVVKAVDNALDFIDATGQVVLKAAPKVSKNKSGTKQIVAIVKALSDIANREGIKANPLWAPPLSEAIEYDSLFKDYSVETSKGMSAVVGLYDDPSHQCQFPAVFDVENCQHLFIVGESGSGKSTLVQTILYSLSERYSPEDIIYYILDFSTHTMNVFSKLPHCGSVIDENNEKDIERFFEMLLKTISERKKLFAEAEANSFEAYRQEHKLPLMLVVIDSMESLSSLEKGNLYFSSMADWMREAGSYGIKFIATGNHLNAFQTKARQECGDRIALKLKDIYEYMDILGGKPKSVPADVRGRGMMNHNGTPLEFHVAMPSVEDSAQVRLRYLKEQIELIATKYATDYTAPKLTTIVAGETYKSFCEGTKPGRIPIGYNVTDVRKIYLPFLQFTKLALYFGNETGFKPVIGNLLYVAKRENARIIVVKKNRDSLFSCNSNDFLRELGIDVVEGYGTNADDLSALMNLIKSEVLVRKQYRNEYFEQKGIVLDGVTAPDADTMREAYKYIRTRSTQTWVVFESFIDFVNNVDDVSRPMYDAFFENIIGYNIFFFGCFRPGDTNKMQYNSLLTKFMTDANSLLFGGQYDKQGLISLPSNYCKMTEPLEDYSRTILSYRNNVYPLIMPCGELLETEIDIDAVPII